MSLITQIISQFLGSRPDGDVMPYDTFNLAAEAFADFLISMPGQLNAFAAQANALSASANDMATILAAANFKGKWTSLTGALAIPACVYHTYQYWILLNNLADVTASEPADGNSDWALLPIGTSIIAKTSDYSITSGQAASGIITFDNHGASADMAFQLPGRGGNYRMGFLVFGGFYLKVKPPSGEQISFYNQQYTAVDGYIRSNIHKTYFEIIGDPSFSYTVINLQGDLKIDE